LAVRRNEISIPISPVGIDNAVVDENYHVLGVVAQSVDDSDYRQPNVVGDAFVGLLEDIVVIAEEDVVAVAVFVAWGMGVASSDDYFSALYHIVPFDWKP
jgi:hypothetical protein